MSDKVSLGRLVWDWEKGCGVIVWAKDWEDHNYVVRLDAMQDWLRLIAQEHNEVLDQQHAQFNAARAAATTKARKSD